jgi:hypothetical protein
MTAVMSVDNVSGDVGCGDVSGGVNCGAVMSVVIQFLLFQM